MSCDLQDPEIDTGLEALRHRAIDWLVVHYVSKDTLALKSTGRNGLEELKVLLRQNQQEAQFGLLCLENKTLLFNVIPESIGGVKRARAVVHTTALRNRVAATIPALATLSVSNADALTVSTVRSKLKLSHIPITTAPPPDLTAPPQPRHSTPISMPPVPPKDHLEPPQSLSTPNSDVGSTSTYFTSDSRDEMQLQSEADALRPLHPSFQTKKRVPSPIMVPTDATPTLRGNNETHLQSPGADTSSGPSFLTYLQNGSAPNSPVQSTVRKPEQKPLPNSPLSPGLDSIHPPTSPASHNTTDDLIDQYASPLSPRGVPDSFVPDSTEEARTESPRHSNGRSDPEPYNFGYRESDQAQSSNTLTDISQDLSRSERPSSRPADFSPPSRSSSLMHSLSSSQGGPREPFEPERRHARGPSNASSNAVSPAQDEYTESISTSIATTADDSSSSPRVSLHQNSRDAALDAELKRQAAWDADAPRRNALPLAEQKLLERNELERRAAAERQRKEIQWRLAMAQQEQSAAEDEERREREAAEQREKEAEAQRLREEEAERAKAEAEEKKRQAAEAKAARQMELKNQFESLSLQEGAIILNGFVSVQQVNSTLWRRRWFELQRQQLRLFKDSNDTTKPMSTLNLRGLRISDGFEETQVAHSFILQTSAGGDPTSFYCDEEADKELLTEALRIAAV